MLDADQRTHIASFHCSSLDFLKELASGLASAHRTNQRNTKQESVHRLKMLPHHKASMASGWREQTHLSHHPANTTLSVPAAALVDVFAQVQAGRVERRPLLRSRKPSVAPSVPPACI
eukprot:1820460-Rhodomonas_salina.2